MTFNNVFEFPSLTGAISADKLLRESPYIFSKDPYYFKPNVETNDNLDLEVDFQIDLIAAIITSDRAFTTSSHIEFIPKPKHNYYLPRSKILFDGFYIHEYPTLKLGKLQIDMNYGHFFQMQWKN